MKNNPTLQHLIDSVRIYPGSDFYRARWGDAAAFSELPTVGRKDFVEVPLSSRRYKEERSLVKIVHGKEGSFLSEWSFDDIGKEQWGEIGARPLVYMTDPHEAIEKSMWCYEQNRVPLIGEKDPDLTIYAAGKYRIDSLITDASALARFAPYFKTHDPLTSLTIIGDTFDTEALMPSLEYARRVRLVAALPETGALAYAELATKPEFRTLPGVVAEEDGELVVTKCSMLVTPVIRYRTGIRDVGLAHA